MLILTYLIVQIRKFFIHSVDTEITLTSLRFSDIKQPGGVETAPLIINPEPVQP